MDQIPRAVIVPDIHAILEVTFMLLSLLPPPQYLSFIDEQIVIT